jgi:hypothetical protein
VTLQFHEIVLKQHLHDKPTEQPTSGDHIRRSEKMFAQHSLIITNLKQLAPVLFPFRCHGLQSRAFYDSQDILDCVSFIHRCSE